RAAGLLEGLLEGHAEALVPRRGEVGDVVRERARAERVGAHRLTEESELGRFHERGRSGSPSASTRAVPPAHLPPPLPNPGSGSTEGGVQARLAFFERFGRSARVGPVCAAPRHPAGPATPSLAR